MDASFVTSLANALKYAAKDVYYGTTATREASALSRHIANGSDDMVGVLSDFLRDHDHPAAPILEKIRDGHATEVPYSPASRLGNYAQTTDYSTHTVQPTHANHYVNVASPDNHDKEAITGINYHHLPNGHFFHVTFGHIYDGHPHRSFYLPTTPDEVKSFADGIAADHPEAAANFHKAVATEPDQPTNGAFNRQLRRAGLDHLAKPEHDAPENGSVGYAASLNAAIKYAAKDVYWGTNATNEVGALARHIANGSNDVVGILSDLLHDHEHPAAPIVEKIRDGHAIEVPNFESDTLGMMHAARPNEGSVAIPRHTVNILNRYADPDFDPAKATSFHLAYFHLPVGHFFHAVFGTNHEKQPQRSFLIPTNEDEVKAYANGLAGVNQKDSQDVLRAMKGEPHHEYDHSLNSRLRNAGMGHLQVPQSEPAAYATDEKPAKYVTYEKHDFHPTVVGSNAHELTNHLVFADWLRENGDEKTADRVQHEINRTTSGQRLIPVHLGPSFTQHDYAVKLLRTAHPSPSVRALAHPTEGGGEDGYPPHDDLASLLLHSDKPADYYAGVFLSNPDPLPELHPAADYQNKLNTQPFTDVGLEAKVVKGKLHLLDWNHSPKKRQDESIWGAPAVIASAPVSDRHEMRALYEQAHQEREERANVLNTTGAVSSRLV